MVQALVLGGMYVMCKQKVNEGEKQNVFQSNH